MPKLARRDIAKVLAERSLGRVSSKQFGQEIAAYLMAEHRTGELESLLRDIMQYRADHGIVEVIAVSAHPLTSEGRADVEARVKGLVPGSQRIIVSEEIDESVVGGVRLELPNQQIDASVRAKLSRLKQLTATGSPHERK